MKKTDKKIQIKFVEMENSEGNFETWKIIFLPPKTRQPCIKAR